MKRIYLLQFLLALCISSNLSFSQTIFYQDIYHGGVTGDGIGTYNSESQMTFNVAIPTNSTIREAFLFVTTHKSKFPSLDSIFYDRKITFNNIEIDLSESDIISSFDAVGNGAFSKKGIIVVDVKEMVSSTQTSYNLLPPPNQLISAATGVYAEFYLYITYENPTLQKLNSLIVLNNQDNDQNINYNINNLNSIDLLSEVGFSIHGTEFCDTIRDGSYVSINGNLLGLIGGDELPPNKPCTGVWGSFNYNNGTLFGLSNDISNNTMVGADALANIQSYITNPNQLDITFEYQDPTNGPYSNSVLQLFLTYSTPCAIFSGSITPDTTICFGETLQLQATGGVPTGTSTSYEWTSLTNPSAINDLSCTDCPNPIFSGDSSTTYTVRIWNTDSCSVVKPISIGISHPQEIDFSTLRSTCSYSTGKIIIQDSPDNVVQLGAVNKNGDTLSPNSTNTFSGLSAGDYTLFYIDKFGCSSDTLVTVEPVISTVAQFNTYPKSGTAPIQINLTNQSQNATDYSWWINDVYQGNQFSGFFTDTSGTFEIELIAWKTDSICADTVSFTVFIFDSLVASLPNVFTPNNDGVNDFFNVKVNLAVAYDLVILNRWGNVVFENEGDLTKGEHKLWNGETKSGEIVIDGTYFYKMVFGLVRESIDCEITECEVVKQGFVQVINN
ncbi:hypothetical protein ERX46_16475 [Brumimicrobium glaciale]|uniref:Gliding motility-associated C-terminal domain-containing protein n=1 Tax=Brumimicrobium glaciale TaxID=200475 RepID=A0A4Q4KFP8_9FLAO|nr:gliding motility-associated C-terminal domain-containing protein [Brumimicrobium glaciale]RYM31500.1 hypothetical protein ERX46_16475 [Brumimicrobium glaciale]